MEPRQVPPIDLANEPDFMTVDQTVFSSMSRAEQIRHLEVEGYVVFPEILKSDLTLGAEGFKLYSGHNVFYSGRLDDPKMMRVYAYAESLGIPLVWHVRLPKFLEEFLKVCNCLWLAKEMRPLEEVRQVIC